jgi:uncharacterized protein YfiM (DUF2279 family)
MAVKALEIIKPALRRIGAIDAEETPSAIQTEVALECLNGIIDTWSATSGVAVNNQEIVVTLPAMAQYMTIGPGQQIDLVRPFRIEAAYARIQGIDRSISVGDKADYDAVNLKTMGTSWPELIWYDAGLPTGKVYFWPLAASSVELHLTVLRYLQGFADSNAEQELPNGYKRALTLTLAVEVAPEFQLDPSASLVKQQALAYRAITRMNHVVQDMDNGQRVSSRIGQFLSGGM